ncbi:hypothetical protein NDU88_005921 [Pleurodeles waltl]|uniref:Uncharacterized protein n=1 Tax=Pleurodeles waltl TaxID=8319 RepID=A0AAV7LMK1_PLEWA|nr:hypothetical protein NDU88_005921 [Pleurodeles waltl]
MHLAVAAYGYRARVTLWGGTAQQGARCPRCPPLDPWSASAPNAPQHAQHIFGTPPGLVEPGVDGKAKGRPWIAEPRGRCWSGLSPRAGAGANWPGRPDRRCAAAPRAHRADHGAGVRGRGRELVWCWVGADWPDRPDRSRAAAAIPCRAVYPPRFLVSTSGPPELLLFRGKGRSFFLPLWAPK